MATFGRRLVAIAIDWGLCQLIALAILGDRWATGGLASFVPLIIFAMENVLLVSTVGYTVGHRIMGLRVVRVAANDSSAPTAWLASLPGLVAGTIRTALLCLAIPALVWDRDGRGWHDRLAKTLILRQPEQGPAQT